MFKIKKTLISLVVIIASSFVISTAIIYAVTSDYYRIDFGQTATIDEWGICKNITRTSSGDIFIPTRTQAEWEAFIDNAIGVNIIDCVASNACPGTPTVTDIDGNIYNTVLIGSQCWTKENLNVTKNPAGTPITRHCYNDDLNICNTDGGLYSWNTAMNGSVIEGDQGICPDGWHIPKDSEWYTLEDGLKDAGQTCVADRFGYDCATAGTKLAQGGSSGFDAVFAGVRNTNGTYWGNNSAQATWSSTEESLYQALNRYIFSGTSTVYRQSGPPTASKNAGFSIRCVEN